MGKASLVDKDIEDGERLLRGLDAANLRVEAALWLLNPDHHEWLLTIATPLVDSDGPRAIYTRVGRVLDRAGTSSISLNDVAVVNPRNQIVSLLRSAIRIPRAAIARVRFTRNVISGVFVEDALIYRL